MEEKNLCSFYATVCHVCKLFPDGKKFTNSLKRCQSCKLIAYCSVEHQQKHWPEHKEFCKILRKLADKLRVSFIFENAVNIISKKEWCLFRSQLKLLCEAMLKRPLMNYEAEMLYFPRVCLLCHEYDQVNLRDCDTCHCVSYCSDSHMKSDAEYHRKSCHELKEGFDFDLLAFQGSLPDFKWDFGKGMICNSSDEFHSTFMKFISSEECSKDFLASQIYFTLFSCPLTFTYSIFKLGLHLSQSLVVHLVGASSFESQHLGLWDIVFHWLRHLFDLHLILIGPNVVVTHDVHICSNCEQAGSKLTVEFCPGQLYHKYIESSDYTKPDVIVMFNCGISEFIDDEQDTWQKSIPYIMTSECPVLLTSYTASEAENDFQRLIKANQDMSIIIRNEKNMYSSRKPLRDWEQFCSSSDTLVFYHNAFLSLLAPPDFSSIIFES